MVVYNSKLYTLVDGSKGLLYEFDGMKWDSIFPGYTSGAPDCFAVWDNKLISGGQYTGVVGVPNTRKIAAWDGINNQWSALATGESSTAQTVNCMTVYKNELYAAGNFVTMGGVSVNSIARWNGTQWNDLGGGVVGGLSYINAMAVYKDEQYVGGSFTQAGGKPAYYVARWNGTQWDSLQGGLDGVVSSMIVDTVKDLLYVGGGFFTADDTIPVNYVAQWDSINWGAPGMSITSGAFAMCIYNNDLYVCGGAPSDTVLARWDGNNWNQVIGPSTDGVIRSLLVYNGNLYVGGDFSNVNGDNNMGKLVCYGLNCPQNVGIEKLQVENIKFKNYPNPTIGSVIIDFNKEVNSIKLKLYNLTGQVVFEKENITGTRFSLDISQKATGIYFIELTEAGKVYRSKLVKN